MYHPPPCITTRRFALGLSPRSPPEALMASPAVVEGAMAAVGVLPRLLPRRMARLLPQTPRAPVPCLPCRHHHATVDERRPAATSPTRTQRTHQVTGRRRRQRRTQAPPGRAPATRHASKVAAARPTCAHSATVLPVSLYSCSLLIKYFVAKLVCLL